MDKCVFCDQHFKLCHNGKSDIFLKKCPCQSKKCNLFISRDEPKIKIKKKVEKLDWTNEEEFHYVDVFWKTSNCFIQKHKRTDYIAKVINHSNEDIIELRVFYCHKCNMFYANGNLLPKQDVLIHLHKLCLLGMPNSYYNYYDMSPQSILSKNGYNARKGSTSYKRHRVIDFVIENEILTPYDIINHLGSLIDWHLGDIKWKEAISKWREDIIYIQNINVERYNGKLKIRHKKNN